MAPDRAELVYAVRRAMKLARLETDQTMDEFAAALSRELGSQQTRQRVNEWEAGDRTPRATVLLAAARVAGTGLDYLFREPPTRGELTEQIRELARPDEEGDRSAAQE